MNIILWFAIGIVVGWLAARFLQTKTPWATGLNVAVGIVGALSGGFIIAPMMGAGLIDHQGISTISLLASFLGALLLLAFFTFVRPRGVR
jgi:uncharacterized membrane protein YeaQ/YmgE (transglycosylase-associated protein family)